MKIYIKKIISEVTSLFDNPLPPCHLGSPFGEPLPPPLGGDVIYEWSQTYSTISTRKIRIRVLLRVKSIIGKIKRNDSLVSSKYLLFQIPKD